MSLAKRLQRGTGRLFNLMRTRIILFLAVILLLICLFSNMALYQLYAANATRMRAQDNQARMVQVIGYANRTFENLRHVADIIWQQELLQQQIDQLDRGAFSPPIYREIIDYLQSIVNTMPYLVAIDLYLEDQGAICTSDGGLYSLSEEQQIRVAAYARATEQVAWVNDYSSVVNMVYFRPRKLITLRRPLYSVTTGEKVGFLALSLNETEFCSMMGIADENDPITILLATSGQQLLRAPRLALPSQAAEQILSSHAPASGRLGPYDGVWFTYARMPENDWILVSSFLESDALTEVAQIRNYILVILATCALAFVFIAVLAERWVLSPVNTLVSQMQRIEEGNFDVRIAQQRPDEFGYIFRSFNNMVEKLQFLFEKSFNEELLKKDAELKLMQSKMDPHFIYNIFNDMNWLLELQQYDTLGRMIDSVSNYYKRSVNFGEDSICIFDNVQLLRYYREIQQIRYPGRFECTIDVAGELMEEKIPNFLLQPLLENAILHGIEPQGEFGHILVSGWREGEEMHFMVQDDGAGIPPDRLQGIREMLESGTAQVRSNYALLNIHRRIRMSYGPAYGLTIESEEGRGTRVSFSLPIAAPNGKKEGDGHVPDADCG